MCWLSTTPPGPFRGRGGGGVGLRAPPPPGPFSPCSTPVPTGGDPRIAAGTGRPGRGTGHKCPQAAGDTPPPPPGSLTPSPCPLHPTLAVPPPPQPWGLQESRGVLKGPPGHTTVPIITKRGKLWGGLRMLMVVGGVPVVPPPGWGSPAGGWLPAEEPLRASGTEASVGRLPGEHLTVAKYGHAPSGAAARLICSAAPPGARARAGAGGCWVVGVRPPAPTSAAVRSTGARVPPPVTAGLWGELGHVPALGSPLPVPASVSPPRGVQPHLGACRSPSSAALGGVTGPRQPASGGGSR